MSYANETEVAVAVQSSNVVQNDKATFQSPFQVALNAIHTLEDKRVVWEEGVYKTSNQALYEILAECLIYGGELTTTEASSARRDALQAFYKERKYRWKAETPLMTKIVRAVFGDIDRRRISTYSLVLRKAKKENILPNDFAAWVEEEGGVQEIRLGQSATFVSPKVKAERAQESFKQINKLASVKTEALAAFFDADKVGNHFVMLAQLEADGSYTVKALLDSGAAVNASFTALYQQQKAANDKEASQSAEQKKAA